MRFDAGKKYGDQMNDKVMASVRVVVPADFRFVALCRVTAASLAAELQFDVDQIEELRIAVNELVSMVVEVSPVGSEIELVYGIDIDCLRVEGRNHAVADVDAPVADGLTTQVLDAVVDGYGWLGASFWLEKRRPPGDGR